MPAVSWAGDGLIVELLYDRGVRETAFAVWRGEAAEIVSRAQLPNGLTLVPYAPSNNLIDRACVLLPSAVAPSGGREQLLADVQAYLYRYVDLSPRFERLAAHYVLLSWVYDAFNDLPILRLQGEYGTGKTRALVALGSVAYRGFFASGASTVSPIFHTLDRFGGTLVLDEADLRYSDKTVELVKILNNGTVRGLPVLRSLQNRHKEFNPTAFNVFGPKILAMRGRFRDRALESRCLTERMGNRPLREDVPVQLPDALKDDAQRLRNRLLDFRMRHLSLTKIDPSRAVEGIAPRLNQMALPLLSLMDDTWAREDFAELLRETNAALDAEREADPEARVVAALERLQGTASAPIPLHAIAREASADEQGPPLAVREVGRYLRNRGIPLRKSHGTIVVQKPQLLDRVA